MTWMIGASTHFAYGIVISDIRVTCASTTGHSWDALQKAFPIGKFMVGGFAGNVSAGLTLIHCLQRFLQDMQPERNECCEPEWVAKQWHREAQNVFDQLTQKNPDIGETHILTVGLSSDSSALGNAKPVVTIFRSPNFEPESIVGGNHALSIGSGSQVERYRESLEHFISDPDLVYMQGELRNTGGFGRTIANAINIDTTRYPVDTVSPYTHLFVVRLGQIEESRANGMPDVATNWDDLLSKLSNPTNAHAFVANAS